MCLRSSFGVCLHCVRPPFSRSEFENWKYEFCERNGWSSNALVSAHQRHWMTLCNEMNFYRNKSNCLLYQNTFATFNSHCLANRTIQLIALSPINCWMMATMHVPVIVQPQIDWTTFSFLLLSLDVNMKIKFELLVAAVAVDHCIVISFISSEPRHCRRRRRFTKYSPSTENLGQSNATNCSVQRVGQQVSVPSYLLSLTHTQSSGTARRVQSFSINFH